MLFDDMTGSTRLLLPLSSFVMLTIVVALFCISNMPIFLLKKPVPAGTAAWIALATSDAVFFNFTLIHFFHIDALISQFVN